MGDILKGKVAVITGSGQGTGRAIAIGFAAQGAKVVTNNRAPKKKGSTAMSGAVLTDEDLAKLELKAKRAAERKSEAAQHEKNLRRGVKRPKKQTETPEERKQDRRAGAKAERGPRKGEKTGKGGPRGKTSARPVPGEKNQRRSGTYEKSAGGKTQGRAASGKAAEGRSGLRKSGPRPFKSDRPKAKRNPFAHSRPVKKGKGSFRKKES